jgi:hypothetical protein
MNLKIVILRLIFLSIFPLNMLYASVNDSTISNILNRIEFNVSGAQLYHMSSNSREALMPDFVNPYKGYYYQNNETFNSETVNVSDNPLFHGAAYFDFKLNFSGYGFTIGTDIFAEHRGISYGVFNTRNMILFPKFRMAFDSSFKLFGEKFEAAVFVGNHENLRLYEGLSLYNMECQGSVFYLKWRNFKLSRIKIGDLEYCIGLGINDVDDFILSAENLCIWNDWKLDIKAGISQYLFSYAFSSFIYPDNETGSQNLSFALHNDNFRIYSQLGIRGSNSNIDFKWRSAFLAGAKYKYESENLRLDLTGEYRYYGYYFNQNLYSKNVHYREIVSSGSNDYISGYANTIGTNLYPLFSLNAPFSQWAVYTEYQNKNVMALVFQLNGTYKFYDNFVFKANLDYNYIRASYEDGFLYPFYNIGIGYEPIKDNYILVSSTNKAMNLDKSYPTFYLYKVPRIMLTFNFNFDLLSRGEK